MKVLLDLNYRRTLALAALVLACLAANALSHCTNSASTGHVAWRLLAYIASRGTFVTSRFAYPTPDDPTARRRFCLQHCALLIPAEGDWAGRLGIGDISRSV
jgi:hypothetical protein